MEVFLVSNNLYENNLSYAATGDIELKKLTRPLSVEGEKVAKEVSLLKDFEDVSFIYSSLASSSLDSAKYLAERIDKKIIASEEFNDCKIGSLGTRSLKMVKFMQNHDFNIKLTGGESLDEVGNRIESAIKKIVLGNYRKVVIYTHKRAILGYLIKYGKTGYNLDDNLIVEYNGKVIYNESEADVDIYKLSFDGKELIDMDIVEML